MRIDEILSKKRTLSFEVFPPKKGNDEINKVFKAISKNYNGVSLINKKVGYSSLNLNFLDEQNRFISEDDLLNNIDKIILVNECFKNALIEINYELEDEKLVENLKAFVSLIVKSKPAAVKGKYILNASVSSTMGPGVWVDFSKGE